MKGEFSIGGYLPTGDLSRKACAVKAELDNGAPRERMKHWIEHFLRKIRVRKVDESLRASRRGFLGGSLAAALALGLVGKGKAKSHEGVPRVESGERLLPGLGRTRKRRATHVQMAAAFERIKATASAEELFALLYALPKGGDIHHHLSGGILPETWWEIATDRNRIGGQRFYSRVRISASSLIASNRHRDSRNTMFWTTISEQAYDALSDWEKGEFKRLDQFSEQERDDWISSVVLDRTGEGRNEFFEYIWPRLNDLQRSIHVVSEALVANMKLFGAEGVRYLELQGSFTGWRNAQDRTLTPSEAYIFWRNRLNQPDALETGVTVRFMAEVLRSAADAFDTVRRCFAFVDQHRDLWVGVNMAGREDDNRGYPKRFTEVFDEMLRRYSGIGISIHAGEAEKADHNVSETLRLGAQRIGHGINLIEDAQTMQLMRNGAFLVEINLISNETLGYVPDLRKHPFPIYMRQGIPCCLNTDDRGMWHSNMTDEYYLAVRLFNLSWSELIRLGENSLHYSFVDPETKASLLEDYWKRVDDFAEDWSEGDWKNRASKVAPVAYNYGRRKLQLKL